MRPMPGRSRVRLVGSRDSATAQSVTRAPTIPTGTLIQKTADQSTCSTSTPPRTGPMASAGRDAGPDADGRAELLAREGRDDDREGQRVHQRPADALAGAERDEPLDARRQGAGDGHGREDHEADQEHVLAAEAVAQLAAEHDQHGERQDVGVDRPLELRRGRVEIALDRGQRHVDDRVVEHDEEEAEAHRGQRQPLVPLGAGGHGASRRSVGAEDVDEGLGDGREAAQLAVAAEGAGERAEEAEPGEEGHDVLGVDVGAQRGRWPGCAAPPRRRPRRSRRGCRRASGAPPARRSW